MSIVIYTEDRNGYHASIRKDKDSSLYRLTVIDSYGQIEKHDYMSIKSAKRAIKRIIGK